MSHVMALRAKFQDRFVSAHGVKLGFMSFFVKAVVGALKRVPAINARIEGDEIISHNFYDIGVAIGTEKGLIVPVLRDADAMNLADVEKAIIEYAQKARSGKITMPDLEGGVFTISNGGVYGSMLSTPILNPPQSGILGMHAIQDRAMVVNGRIEVRPMMYLALSYDHRLVDGKEAVTFLVSVKEAIENPGMELLGL
jgi:2-oxoglutarate dehydrogenase E2 component (dihydrolipoamide succinyltransferase)